MRWFVVVVAALLWPGVTVAQDVSPEFERQFERCRDRHDAPDMAIGACTVLLRSGELSDDGYVWVYTWRGTAYSNVGQYDDAIHDLDQALRLNTESAEAYLQRGVAYANSGLYERAIHDYNRAIQHDPDYYLAYYNLGVNLKKLGDIEQAIQSYEHALRINPNDAYSLNNLAWIFATEPQFLDSDRAISLAQQSVALDERAASLDTLAAAYVLAGRTEDALREYGSALRMSSQVIEAAQEWLLSAGHYDGPIDGDYGPATQAAVEACVRAGCQLFVD